MLWNPRRAPEGTSQRSPGNRSFGFCASAIPGGVRQRRPGVGASRDTPDGSFLRPPGGDAAEGRGQQSRVPRNPSFPTAQLSAQPAAPPAPVGPCGRAVPKLSSNPVSAPGRRRPFVVAVGSTAAAPGAPKGQRRPRCRVSGKESPCDTRGDEVVRPTPSPPESGRARLAPSHAGRGPRSRRAAAQTGLAPRAPTAACPPQTRVTSSRRPLDFLFNPGDGTTCSHRGPCTLPRAARRLFRPFTAPRRTDAPTGQHLGIRATGRRGDGATGRWNRVRRSCREVRSQRPRKSP